MKAVSINVIMVFALRKLSQPLRPVPHQSTECGGRRLAGGPSFPKMPPCFRSVQPVMAVVSKKSSSAKTKASRRISN